MSKGKWLKLTPHQKRLAVKKYLDGEKVEAICASLGVKSTATVSQIVQRAGVPLRRRSIEDVRLHQNGI